MSEFLNELVKKNMIKMANAVDYKIHKDAFTNLNNKPLSRPQLFIKLLLEEELIETENNPEYYFLTQEAFSRLDTESLLYKTYENDLYYLITNVKPKYTTELIEESVIDDIEQTSRNQLNKFSHLAKIMAVLIFISLLYPYFNEHPNKDAEEPYIYEHMHFPTFNNIDSMIDSSIDSLRHKR